MSNPIHQENAAYALDRMRLGGANLVLTAHQRLGEIRRSLDHGHFTEAYTAAAALQEKLGHLAGATQTLGRLADAYITTVGQLEPGMKIVDAGRLVEVGPCPGCGQEHCENVTLTMESGASVVLDRGDEIVVAAE